LEPYVDYFYSEPVSTQSLTNYEFFWICESNFGSLRIFYLDNSIFAHYPESWKIPDHTRMGSRPPFSWRTGEPEPYRASKAKLSPFTYGWRNQLIILCTSHISSSLVQHELPLQFFLAHWNAAE
jgi:hypothetical protein